jgi:CubicO group peptidase (beta-lactamase class C family)
MSAPSASRNPDLDVVLDNKPRWNLPDHRRAGFHNLHRIYRYGLAIRAPDVLELTKCIDPRIAELDAVRQLTGTPHFSGMVVARGARILFERYASDFGPDRPHSIQSITKTTMNLIVGRLVEDGRIDLGAKVSRYLPEIGSGYARASVQQVLNMDVANDFTEDYTDPFATSYLMETAMGWRLPPPGEREPGLREYLMGIRSDDIGNPTGHALYKSANTDVLGWIAERVSGRPLREWLIDIMEAAGIEGVFHIATDRGGVPVVDGGGCLAARDLARYGLLLARRGVGVGGRRVGSAAFIERSRREPGPPMPPPREWLRYSNQLQTDGEWVGHGGYGGQYLLVNLATGVVVVFYSVLEDADAHDPPYQLSFIRMAAEVSRMELVG